MAIFSTSIFSVHLNVFGKNSGFCDEVVSSNLRDFICHHQGAFIQYTFLAGEYHKAMKKEYYKENKELDSIKEKHDQLLDYLNESFADTVTKSFELIKRLYSGRHIKLPRVCLKANFNPDKDEVVAMFRDQEVSYFSDCSVNDNKGFQYVKDNGKFYHCPDIPKATAKGEYFNPRLLKGAVNNYHPSGLLKKFINSKNKNYVDDAWLNCWTLITTKNGQKIQPNFHDCYKSTLVIPLTLWNNKLDKRFLDKFNIKGVNRTIFGYLCFDHIETNYFDPSFDVDVGYIFADILSLYFLVRFIFINQSKTYNEVNNYLLQYNKISKN